LRRRLPSSPVLVSHRVQAGGRDTGARRAAESPLHCRRDAPVAAVSDDPGARTDRDHAVAATERCLSVPYRSAELPRGHDAPALLAAGGADGPPQTAYPARSLSPPDDWPAPIPDAADLRPRLHRVDRVRPPGARAHRLQPHQAGPSLVSPVALLRGPDQGLLAWRATTRRRAYVQRDPRSARGVLREDPDQGPAHDCPRRQRLLRPQADRVARSSASPLRDRRPAHAPDQAQAPAPARREPQSRRRGRRVSVPADPLASALSFHRHPSARAGGPDRATDPLQAWEVPLPSSGHEPPAPSAQPLALLQRPRRRGTAHQATQRGLRPG